MILREVREDDLPILFEHQREPEAARMAAVPSRDLDAFMSHWRTKVLGSASIMKKTIVVGGEIVGNIVSWESEGVHLVGYWIGNAYWGRGIATAALVEFVTRCQTMRPLYAHVSLENVGSFRVLEKCGFRQVGEVVTGDDGIDERVMRLETIPLTSQPLDEPAP